MDEITVMAGLVRDLQKEGDGHLCSGKSRILRDVRHGDPVLSAVFHIHDIKAGRETADILKIRELFQNFFRETGLVCKTDRYAFQPSEDLGRCGVVIYHQLAELFERSPGDVSRVFGVSVQYYDLHFSSPQ